MIRPENYFHNKAFDLPTEMRDMILRQFEYKQHKADIFYKRYYYMEKHSKNETQVELFKKHYNEAVSNLRGMQEILATMGILVEYDWPGHRREWFFPTYDEVLGYEDFLFQCAD